MQGTFGCFGLRCRGSFQRWCFRVVTVPGEEPVGGGDPNGQLLRHRSGKPIPTRRYDHLWLRLGKHLPWVAVQQISTHWLRHTTLTWVERNFSFAVARAYAGHNGKNDAGTTSTYVRADVYEVAQALAALTGEPHPLASVPVSGQRPPERHSHSPLDPGPTDG